MHFFRKELLNINFWGNITAGEDILVIGGSEFSVNYTDTGESKTDEDLIWEYCLQHGAQRCERVVLDYEVMYHDQQGEYRGDLLHLDKVYTPESFSRIIVLSGLEKTGNPLVLFHILRILLKKDGYMDLLFRTPKYRYAQYPISICEDKWRFTAGDIQKIFCQDEIEIIGQYKDEIMTVVRIKKMDCDYSFIQDKLYSYKLQNYVKPEELPLLGYFAEYTELDNIGTKEDTDKNQYQHNYLDKYEFFLRKWKNRRFDLLELGIFTGGSARMWEKYFENAIIHCVDIQPACSGYATQRIKPYIMDLGIEANLQALKAIQPAVIVDDASHFWDHQIMALFNLYDSLPHGGVYILEDLETSVNQDLYPDYSNGFSIDAYTVCERITKVVVSRTPDDISDKFSEQITEIGMATEMVSTIKGSCIFIKR
ncbi:hypothetical protein SAMN05216587_1157 [Selenomonas ruminantium]|uniref:Methyltransferase domain-containing protein n=1 Tax=Selenomonas ruminantium TaxID=971 RepID=A0A1I0YK02_SELRU|nr:hypothetical protein SAMN05216587_1157 [Selenomonas ruminantium]